MIELKDHTAAGVVSFLRSNEEDELDQWIGLDLEMNEKLCMEIAKVADDDPEPIYQYCRELLPAEFSSLEIVYASFSQYSEKHFMFLSSEVQRLLLLLESGTIGEERVEVLESIDMEQMYEHDQESYVQSVLHVVKAIDPGDSKTEKLTLFSILIMYLYDYDSSDQLFNPLQQFSYINELAQSGPAKVRKEASEVMALLGVTVSSSENGDDGNPLMNGFKKLMGW